MAEGEGAQGAAGATPTIDTRIPAPDAENMADKIAARESARRYVRGIVNDRMSIIDHRVNVGKENPANLSEGERVLLTVAGLDRGLSTQTLQDNPQGIPLSEDGSALAVIIEKNGIEQTVKVLSVTDQKVEMGQNNLTGEEQQRATSYMCLVDGEHDPIEIPAADIQAAYLATNASLIAESFPADGDLITWGLRDADNNDDIPPAIDEALGREANPMVRANRVLELRMQQLQVDIKALEGKDLAEAQKLLAELEAAMKANGQELGAWAKMKGLKALEAVGVDTGYLQAELQPEADKAKQLLDQLLEGAKLSESEKTALDTKDLNTILADKGLMKKLLSIDGLKEKLFGDTPDDELGEIAKKFLSKEQIEKLQKEHGSGWWKIALYIAAGLVAAIPVGTVGAGFVAVNSLNSQR